MKIAIPAGHFQWVGGIDFVKYLIRALLERAVAHDATVVILIPDSHESLLYKRSSRATARVVIWMGMALNRFVDLLLNRNVFSRAFFDDAYGDFRGTVEFAYYSRSRAGLAACLEHVGADVVLPVLRPLGRRFPFPWVGYVFDLQHKYYPQYFGWAERLMRDVLFRTTTRTARVTIVNAEAVCADLVKYYSANREKIVVLPFSAFPAPEWLLPDDSDVQKRFDLPERFFLISNQLFVHKSHVTAFEALQLLREDSRFEDVHVLCTGDTKDLRDPEFFETLLETIDTLGVSARVRFLGHIDKLDQIRILKRSVALLQPTLFEGGAGGGSTRDAIAVGKRAIISDIPVNCELQNDLVTFFAARDASSLAASMTDVLCSPEQSVDAESLRTAEKERLRRLGDVLFDIVGAAIG
jgi:glycosyltransferase involved in cell wall biosynthesis